MSHSKEPFAQRLIGWFGGRDDAHKETFVLKGRSSACAPETVTSPAFDERYEIIRTLGKGAYGVVSLARDRRIGRLVAVKKLNSDLRINTTVYKHFLQEARIAGQLDNPNIITIYDVQDDDAPSILMEFLGGGSLGQLIRRDAPLDEVEALELLRGIMEGLKAAHAIGVVHRDIKPSNILFDQNGIPKVSDFGVALMPVEVGGVNDETDRNTFVVGTPDYMSPEQLRPNEIPVDPRADIYACGLMLFEMLTGRRHQAFGKMTSHRELQENMAQRSLPGDCDFPPHVSRATRDLVRSLIKHRPSKRPDSATDVINLIDETIMKNLGREDVKDSDREGQAVRKEMFADILRIFLVDGVISAAERRELTLRARRLGILPVEAIGLEEAVRREHGLPTVRDLQRYSRKAEFLLFDRDLSQEDRKILDELGSRYNISDAERQKIEENIMVKFQMKEGTVEDLIP